MARRFRQVILCMALLAATVPALASPPAPATTPNSRPAIALYAGSPPAGPVYANPEKSIQVHASTALLNVSTPTLTPVFPAAGHSNGTAVIVVPGGAYIALAIDHEGYNEARWLAAHGVIAFVLKYRVTPTSGDLAQMSKAAAAAPPKAAQTAYQTYNFPPAVADAQAAVRLVRTHAGEWGIDPTRIGMLGFSAGAISTLLAGTSAEKQDRPDFMAAIYPPLEPLNVPTDAPPLFVAIALDDELFAGRGFGLIDAWQRARRPIEAHLYERGGHGFGMGKPETTTTGWMQNFYGWMAMHGLVSDLTK